MGGRAGEWWADSLFFQPLSREDGTQSPGIQMMMMMMMAGELAMLMVLNFRKHARADVEGLATRWRYKYSNDCVMAAPSPNSPELGE